ncbi:hypothetical protein FA95DRAFT_1591168 [Auriscalpium vulgare]|uniref:Uncharacterized protein n=1 Tax=Auriscalpium vulgare TaxID=40419 RepID=A0ACB8RA55_9AGAM|nr:hypothetical protein FA95DRAFT_1591168 [Auriscalpium vulgare]
MTSVAGRKKSIISPANVDMPIGNNTLLNKAASQSTSLYQQCSSLRSRLLRIRAFDRFFAIASPRDSPRQSTDPVTQLWDCFALGTPLCYLFNLLPAPAKPIPIETDPNMIPDIHADKTKKRAIALFAMQVKQLDNGEQFTVTDLWDRNSTDGFVKVVNTVTHLVDRLPEDVFVELSPPSPTLTSQDSLDSLAPETPLMPVPANAQEAARNNIIRELVETERKYVQDLEVMQKYSNALSQSSTIDHDTIHLLFPNLNKLLNFQRKFLIRLESTAEMTWRDQRWGVLFADNEEEFAVYEPYCANYTNASELMIMEEQNLMKYSHLINAKSELPAFLIKPVQRICKYPLLLDSLLKASSPAEYPHYEELKAGSAAAKRITDKINEAQRRAENIQTVQNLATRVDDWKGHHVSQFGELLLDDIFIVTKSEVDREYHVFLFERIILCCKEDIGAGYYGKKVGKSNSILKKPQTPTSAMGPAPGSSKKKTTPLLLKGRIYLNNRQWRVIPLIFVMSSAEQIYTGAYSLNIWWKGDDDLEFFTLRCRNEEQVRQWETSVKRLIERVAMRRASERSTSRLAYQMNHGPSASRVPQSGGMLYSPNGNSSLPSHPYGNGGRSLRQSNPYGTDDHLYSNGNFNGPAGYPPHDGFDPDDEYEDYPPTMLSPSSGRATPIDGRRGAATPNMDQLVQGYDRPRAQTEDASGAMLSQWRQHNASMAPSPVNGLPSGPSPRPTQTRLNSTMSFASDSSFGPGVGSRPAGARPPLRSQFSSTRLRSTYENTEARAASPAVPVVTPTALHRSRSASQPTAYVPKHAPPPPPLPSGWDRSKALSTETKRSSGSSHSTGEDSGYSPNSSSPITPFGSSDSSLSGMAGRSSLSSSYDHGHGHGHPPAVKVKVHFGNDIFVIQVPRATEYHDLVERVGKKIRLCGPRREDGPLRVKYEDEEGDLISMRSTEDVDMAFGGKTQVVLHVA